MKITPEKAGKIFAWGIIIAILIVGAVLFGIYIFAITRFSSHCC